MNELLSRKNLLPIFIILFFAVLASRTLLFQSGYFKMHDDLQMMRQLEMEKCFQDGQIPCRWVPDLGYGYGFPLFNFYPPLPYLIGETFRLVGFSFVDTVKLTFALSIILSGLTMYLLSKEFFGRIGGVLSSVFYIWAPYRAVDIFVRGAMNESWAFVWFPLIFWSVYRLVISERRKELKWIILLALSYFALLTSHNLAVLIFTPFLGLWVLLHLWREDAWSRLPQLVVSVIWAVGLAAFFTLPALAENQFTHIREQLEGYFDYTAHFVNIRQLLVSRFWDYGGSAWEIVNDKMSFQIGHVHWILSLVIGFWMIIRYLAKKGGLIERFRKDKILLISIYFLMVGWFSAFMTHSRSTFIYTSIPQLGYVQFPWRFLTIVTFSFSFISGVVPGALAQWKSRHNFIVKIMVTPPQVFIAFIFVLALLLLNWRYFRPEGGKMGSLTDAQKFSGAAWELQQGGGARDYLPKTAKVVPESPRQKLAEMINGKGTISEAEQGTYWVKFRVKVDSDEAVARINLFDFPGWRVFADNSEIEKFIPDEETLGRIWIKVPSGNHLIYAQFFNTPIRTVANLISLFSWTFLIWALLVHRRKII